MGKKVLGVAFLIAAIAVPFVAPAALGLAAGSFAAIAATAAIEVGISIASSVLIGPSVPKIPGSLADGGRDRLNVSMDPTAPRKIWLGNTAGATDLRYQTFTGSNQDFYHQVIAVASHEAQSIDEIWIDNEKAWNGSVLGRFVGYLTVTTRTVGTNANGVAIDGTWTASCTLTGCTYIIVKYRLSDISDNNKSPFAGGVSQRMTVRGKGAKCYDPRLDSTVTGGSGSHRADDQSTWAWDDSGSRNPALQLLWFLLGWRINGLLAVGMGIPKDRIDLASFITAANVCDEIVTLNGGGTEPRYRSDGVLSEADDRRAVIEALCLTMNATLRDAGGKLALKVLVNDLASPVASFTEGDILADGEWSQTPDLHETFNITRGRRVDPSDNALYQPVDYPEVKLTSLDGIDRIDTVDFMLVQSNGQAQRLAKQRLQRGQYQGRYSFTGGERWWQVNIGEVVQLSHQGLGWSNKLFRMVAQKIARTGETDVTLLEENSAIYAWANDEAAAVVAGTPTIYDPRNSPLLQGIVTGQTAVGTNQLQDAQFGNSWTFSAAGAVRITANATGGYAIGNQPYALEFSPDTSLVRSAKSALVPVRPATRIYFSLDVQRGTSLGSGSRLNLAHEWVQADGSTLSATSPVEGAQLTPSSVTAGAAPVRFFWSDAAPADAAFVRIKPYTPALASSSGTFRVEAPVLSMTEVNADITRWIDDPAQSLKFKYGYDGVADTGEFNRDLTFRLSTLAGQVMSGIAWTYKVVNGTVNGFTSASGAQSMSGSGTGTLTVSSLGSDSASVEVAATIGSLKTIKTISLEKSIAPPPTGGGGSTTTLASKNSGWGSVPSTTTFVVVNTLTGTMPAGKTTANLNASLNFDPVHSGSAGSKSWTVEMKWQRNISGTWTDIGSPAVVSGSSSLNAFNEPPLVYDSSPAGITNNKSDSGLTAGNTYDWRVVVRVASGSSLPWDHYTAGSLSITA